MRARSIPDPCARGPTNRTLHELQNPDKPRASHPLLKMLLSTQRDRQELTALVGRQNASTRLDQTAEPDSVISFRTLSGHVPPSCRRRSASTPLQRTTRQVVDADLRRHDGVGMTEWA